jgi:iron complex outermembrane receptor protein
VGVSLFFLLTSFHAHPLDESDADVVELDRIEITGSRIKRVDVEGSTPVTIITRDMIDAAGDSTIAELLRSSPYNSFGSYRDRSGFVNGLGVAGFVNLRGLGAQRTLVLLNGRRMSKLPGTGADAADINLIPIDMVERVEILRDGASAIYGSDAIAGVVNIITRKDMDGAVATIQIEDPNPPGGEAERYSVAGGISSGTGNVTFAIEHFERDPIFERDIPRFADITQFDGITSFGFPGSGLVLGGPLFFLNFVDPRCPSKVGDSELFPQSFRWDFSSFEPGSDWGFSARCGYNFAADIMFIPRTERTSAWLDARFDISPRTRFLARALLTQNEGESRYAGAPVTFPFPTYAADNPNNPLWLFIGQTITDPGLGGSYTFTEADLAPVAAYIRTVPNGTRNSFQYSDNASLFTGFEGENAWFGGSEWDIGFEYARNRSLDTYKNLANSVELQHAIDRGELDYFNVQGLDHETWLSNTIESMTDAGHTGLYQGDTTVVTLDGSLRFDLFRMNNGPVPAVIGFEFFDIDFNQEYDPESNRGIIAGGAGGDIVQGVGRDVFSFFAETVVPLGSTLELNLAVRYDDYSDFGSTTNPKVSVAWRPADDWLLRASWGTGFRAPNMLDIYVPERDHIGFLTDQLGCTRGAAPCHDIEILIKDRRNLELQPEESESWAAGVIWNATDSLSLELTWYQIEFTDHIVWGGADTMLNLERDGLPSTVVRGPDGMIDHIVATMWNLSGTRTSGVDFTAQYSLVTERAGYFSFNLEWTRMLESENEIIQGSGFHDLLDYIGTPEDRGALSINWTLGDFQVGWVTHYTGENGASENLCWPSFEYGPCPDGEVLLVNDALWIHDLQLAWNTSWNGQIAAGARNLFNEDPPYLPCCRLPQSAVLFNFPLQLYDAQGRIIYLRYKQNF